MQISSSIVHKGQRTNYMTIEQLPGWHSLTRLGAACSDREWRQDLRQQIKSVTAKRGLNASQTEAIALAMVSSVTLWQASSILNCCRANAKSLHDGHEFHLG